MPSALAAPALPDFAPDRAGFYLGDPHAAFRRLRAADPVHWYAAGGFWCLTKHADVQHVSRSPRLFCSRQGTQIFEIAVRREGGRPLGGRMPGATTILQMDPPQHNRHRKLVMPWFLPRAVARLEGPVRALARECLAAVPPGETVDFVEALAVPLPMFVIADLLGVPREDRASFRRWSDAMIRAGSGDADAETFVVIGEFLDYLRAALAERRRAPRADLISDLLRAEIDGGRLSEAELVMFCLTLLVAGNETTRNLVSGGTLALLEHPAELRRLLGDPALLPNAIEEMLRWVSPVRSFVRCATEATELRGRAVAAGEYLVLLYGAANRDEEVFGPDAERFDVARPTARQHVAFGFGEHLCLGAALARLEARVLFEELLPRLPGLERAGPVEPLPSTLMNGIERMPVRFAR